MVEVLIGSFEGTYETKICPDSNIEIRDIPTKSLFAVKEALNMENYQYVDTEIVTWSARNLEQNITFAYIPPPHHYFRSILLPFVGISFLSQWFVILVGFLTTFVFTSVLKPTITDIAKSLFKSKFDKLQKKEQPRKVTLIVSGKGEEKEIEVKDSND